MLPASERLTMFRCRAVYELQAPGRDGHNKAFHKPWACTTMMFVGAHAPDSCPWDSPIIALGLLPAVASALEQLHLLPYHWRQRLI